MLLLSRQLRTTALPVPAAESSQLGPPLRPVCCKPSDNSNPTSSSELDRTGYKAREFLWRPPAIPGTLTPDPHYMLYVCALFVGSNAPIRSGPCPARDTRRGSGRE